MTVGDQAAGAERAITRRERLGLALRAFCDSLLEWLSENNSKPLRDRKSAFRGVVLALRAARAEGRRYP